MHFVNETSGHKIMDVAGVNGNKTNTTNVIFSTLTIFCIVEKKLYRWQTLEQTKYYNTRTTNSRLII